MKKILLLLLAPLYIQAQAFEWVRFPAVSMQYNPDMIGYSVATDNDGNSYVAGFEAEPFIYNDILGNQFIRKYDGTGNLLFTKTITGKVQTHNLAVDSQQHIIVTLTFLNHMAIGDVAFDTQAQGEQQVIAKFDSTGNLVWSHWMQPVDMGGNLYNEITELRALTLDASDNVIIGYSDFSKATFKKYSPDGTPGLQIEQLAVRRITSVSVDEAGNFYAAGSCLDFNAQFAGVAIEQDFNYSTYVVKYDSQGNYAWSKIIEDITCSDPRVMVSDTGVYWVSALFGTIDIDGISLESSSFLHNSFIARFNSGGNLQWARATPADGYFTLGNRNYLEVDASGNAYLSGQTRFHTIWGNGVETDISDFSSDAVVIRYNSSGDVTAAKKLDTDTYSAFNSVSADPSGNIVVSGYSMGTTNFDGVTNEMAPVDSYYPFLAKINFPDLSNSDENAAEAVMIYPNPAKNQLFISGINGSANISIYNTLGQFVLHKMLQTGQFLDVSNLPCGVYLVRIDDNPAMRLIKE